MKANPFSASLFIVILTSLALVVVLQSRSRHANELDNAPKSELRHQHRRLQNNSNAKKGANNGSTANAGNTAITGTSTKIDSFTSCLTGKRLSINLHDTCNFETLSESIQTRLSNIGPKCARNNATLEIQALFQVDSEPKAKLAVAEVCRKALFETTVTRNKRATFDFGSVTGMDQEFNKAFFDGGSNWNEGGGRPKKNGNAGNGGGNTNAGTASNKFRGNAARVDLINRNVAMKRIMSWPEELENFESCSLSAAMCCWVEHDDTSIFKKYSKNTDICYVDLSRAPSSNYVGSGVTKFEGTEDAFCHGFAWEEGSATDAYKGNMLFHMEVFENMHKRGLSRNVPGSPMCGCIEKMPVVTRSDCSEIKWDGNYIYRHLPNGSKNEVYYKSRTMDFTDCEVEEQSFNGGGNSSNDLRAYYHQLHREGKVSDAQLRQFDGIIVGEGENSCDDAFKAFVSFDDGSGNVTFGGFGGGNDSGGSTSDGTGGGTVNSNENTTQSGENDSSTHDMNNTHTDPYHNETFPGDSNTTTTTTNGTTADGNHTTDRLHIIPYSARPWEASRIFKIENASGPLKCSLNGMPYYSCGEAYSDVYLLALHVGTHSFAVQEVYNHKKMDLVEFVVESIFHPGATIAQDPSTPAPDQSGYGSFHLSCWASHISKDDPVAFPGQSNASHMHTYFSNTLINANSTHESLMTSGASTCQGGSLSRSGYWVPTLLSNAAPVPPRDHPEFIYSGPSAPQLHTMPSGLRMTSGDATATEPQCSSCRHLRWECVSWENDHHPAENPHIWTTHIPRCNIGDAVRFIVAFPNCWDGKNLDSPDHRSHVAEKIPMESSAPVCPDTHPIEIPTVQFVIQYDVTAESAGPEGDSRHWHLSSDNYDVEPDIKPGGYSIHADMFMAWHPEAMDALTHHCIKAGKSCVDGSLGNGWRLVWEEK